MTSEYIHTKVCRICGRELPLCDFNINTKAKDGHRNECRQCYSEIVMRRRKGEEHQVKHRIDVHQAKAKPRKKRVPSGEGERSEYTHQYYEAHKAELKAKNRADYMKRVVVKVQTIPPKPTRLCDTCTKRPCVDGFDNLSSLGFGPCRDYKEGGAI